MDDLVAFARRDDLPGLPQIAIAHAQFETVHPFPFGNGCAGRALIQAMLRRLGVTGNDDGVWLGSLSALGELPAEVDAVVSLSRVGAEQVPAGVESIRVRLIGEPEHNANLDFVLTDAADTIAALRAEGKQVFVHCAEARSRTAAVAALYAIRHCGIAEDQAWNVVADVLPHFALAQFNRDAVAHICAKNSV